MVYIVVTEITEKPATAGAQMAKMTIAWVNFRPAPCMVSSLTKLLGSICHKEIPFPGFGNTEEEN